MRATRTTTEKAAAAKPYDRPAKGKGSKAAKSDSTKAEASASTSKATVNIGAPSAKQSSRKGKKAWRKNVDITAEETALETAREEERVTGGKIDEKKDGELFTIDTTGDIEGEYSGRRGRRDEVWRYYEDVLGRVQRDISSLRLEARVVARDYEETCTELVLLSPTLRGPLLSRDPSHGLEVWYPLS